MPEPLISHLLSRLAVGGICHQAVFCINQNTINYDVIRIETSLFSLQFYDIKNVHTHDCYLDDILLNVSIVAVLNGIGCLIEIS